MEPPVIQSSLNIPPRGERGVVLVITLVMLLMLSLIGISSMSGAKLETHLARNSLLSLESFNNAESSMLIGESNWMGTLDSCLADIVNCSEEDLSSLVPLPQPLTMVDGVPDMSLIDWSAEGNSHSAGTYGGYYVEYMGFRPIPGDAERILHIYRFTARGLDQTGASSTMVQTLYRHCLKIDGVPCPS